MATINLNRNDVVSSGVRVNDKVTYRDINLYSYRGYIVSIGPTPHGGDCMVNWIKGGPRTCACEECQANLRVVTKPVETKRRC